MHVIELSPGVSLGFLPTIQYAYMLASTTDLHALCNRTVPRNFPGISPSTACMLNIYFRPIQVILWFLVQTFLSIAYGGRLLSLFHCLFHLMNTLFLCHTWTIIAHACIGDRIQGAGSGPETGVSLGVALP